MMKNLLVINQVYQIIYNFYNSKNFVEVEIFILINSTPKCIRDYLIQLMIHNGKFYVLLLSI